MYILLLGQLLVHSVSCYELCFVITVSLMSCRKNKLKLNKNTKTQSSDVENKHTPSGNAIFFNVKIVQQVLVSDQVTSKT